MAEYQCEHLCTVKVVDFACLKYYRLTEMINNLNASTEKAHEKNKPCSFNGILENPQCFFGILQDCCLFFFRNKKEDQKNDAHHEA
ncbi:hypothetical protein GCM10023262_13210 [Bartonella pachyuromydis]|uniref:Uncharacterized protein n=1 Tax=Bartonella pachyuromydis TaxID=931097 RepID=A0ABP8VKZ6_9HYPH